MKSRTKQKPNIERRLAGSIELKDGQYVFVPKGPPQKKKVVYVPYWNNQD